MYFPARAIVAIFQEEIETLNLFASMTGIIKNNCAFVLCLIGLCVLCIVANAANIEGTSSPDGKYAITHGENGEVCLVDQKSGKRVEEISPENGATVEAVIGKWSPDGSKVAVVVQHRKWNDVFVFERSSKGFRKVTYNAPDVFAIYAQQRPKDHPEMLKRLTNDDSVVGWINNSEVAMVASFDASDPKNTDDIYTVSVNYVLEIREGKVTVKNTTLKVSP